MALVRARSAARTLIKTVCRVVAAPCAALLCPEWRDNQRQARNFQHISPGYIQHPFSLRPHVRTSDTLPPLHSSCLLSFLLRQCSGCSFCLVLAFFRLFVCFIELSALSLLCLCPQPGRTRSEREREGEWKRERERATGTGKSAESNNLLSNSR